MLVAWLCSSAVPFALLARRYSAQRCSRRSASFWYLPRRGVGKTRQPYLRRSDILPSFRPHSFAESISLCECPFTIPSSFAHFALFHFFSNHFSWAIVFARVSLLLPYLSFGIRQNKDSQASYTPALRHRKNDEQSPRITRYRIDTRKFREKSCVKSKTYDTHIKANSSAAIICLLPSPIRFGCNGESVVCLHQN